MSITLEIGTQNYLDDLLCIKKHLSHMESLLRCYASYNVSEPSSKFGWTFFKISFKPDLQDAIEKKFADMLEKYVSKTPSQKFTDFMTNYFQSKGCKIKIKPLDS